MGSVSAGIAGAAAAVALIGGAGMVAGRPSSAAPPTPARSLCIAAETPLFACSVGSRQVAVCASGGRAVYRYGRPGRIELASASLAYAERGFSGGGESQITATRGGYGYTVYARTLRTGFGDDGRNDPQSASGLLVRRDGRTLSARTCVTDAGIDAAARTLLPSGRFVDH